MHRTDLRSALTGAGVASAPLACFGLTGAALPWNPTRSPGVGVGVLVTCPAGLLVGSGTDQFGAPDPALDQDRAGDGAQ
ncbi:hypothetical protein [Dactylosporangium sp. NPDC051484]|uniref:hypothetical protein n=1 Tax=Dactylosporangium sp. NPDC051484 TaxID=3154942 RepID=UPI00344EE274